MAVNLQNGTDINGVTKKDGRIMADTPFSYEATLPTRKIVEAIQLASIPAQLSYSVTSACVLTLTSTVSCLSETNWT